MPLRYTDRFIDKYAALPLVIRNKVDKALKMLENDFRHPGLQSHSLGGSPGIFEARVDQRYRLTYERSGNILNIRNVDNHDECLKNP
jgi:mRNA-degrading endonuclease RelE of RelBE toxin-antitoxin system